jgi:hypothetical protein
MSNFSVTEAQDNDLIPDAGDVADYIVGEGYGALAKETTEAVLNDRIQAHAEATLEGVGGETLTLQGSRQQRPEKLEETALRALYDKLADDSSGSLAINGSASENKEGLADLDVGDWFMVDPSVETRCDIDVLTGLFTVNSIQHRISGSRGWKTTVDISQIPDPDLTTTRTWFYDPSTDQTFESINAYNEFKQSN